MLKVHVDHADVRAELARVRDRLDDMAEVFEQIGALIESRVHTRFDTKTDPDGKAWAPWAPSTARARAREGRGTLLEYTGRMRDSLTYEAFNDRVEVGFGVDYAGAHEFGSKKKNMPARHMLLSTQEDSLGEEDLADVLDLIGSYIDD